MKSVVGFYRDSLLRGITLGIMPIRGISSYLDLLLAPALLIWCLQFGVSSGMAVRPWQRFFSWLTWGLYLKLALMPLFLQIQNCLAFLCWFWSVKFESFLWVYLTFAGRNFEKPKMADTRQIKTVTRKCLSIFQLNSYMAFYLLWANK